MDKLLTQKDVAERWQLSVKCIEDYRKQGILVPVKGIPAIRFTLQYILELEGVKLDRMSPIERKKLERENAELYEENSKLKGIIANVLAETSKIVNFHRTENGV